MRPGGSPFFLLTSPFSLVLPLPSIRPGAPADAAALAEFAARTFADAFGPDNAPENLALFLRNTYNPGRQGAELADPAVATLLVEAGRVLAGYAQVKEGRPPACVTGADPIELWRFYVDRPWHGKGLAQRLMDAVVMEARRRNAATLWLGVWEKNPRARRFYAKCGFSDIGSQTFFLGREPQTDRVMVRDIS
ncbi:MAG: GNAT family N-acetyltransferase [Gemmatimonadales bacterium]